jgi:hypothetical protein
MYASVRKCIITFSESLETFLTTYRTKSKISNKISDFLSKVTSFLHLFLRLPNRCRPGGEPADVDAPAPFTLLAGEAPPVVCVLHLQALAVSTQLDRNEVIFIMTPLISLQIHYSSPSTAAA